MTLNSKTELLVSSEQHNETDFFQINKYFLFIIVLGIVYCCFLVPRLYCLLTYEKTEGRVVGYYEQWIQTKRGGYTKYYPIVEFETKDYTVKFIAPSIMYEEAKKQNLYKVIYNKNNMEKAYAVSFLGLWGPSFTYLLPISLIWAACIFGVGFIPKMIKIKKPGKIF